MNSNKYFHFKIIWEMEQIENFKLTELRSKSVKIIAMEEINKIILRI